MFSRSSLATRANRIGPRHFRPRVAAGWARLLAGKGSLPPVVRVPDAHEGALWWCNAVSATISAAEHHGQLTLLRLRLPGSSLHIPRTLLVVGGPGAQECCPGNNAPWSALGSQPSAFEIVDPWDNHLPVPVRPIAQPPAEKTRPTTHARPLPAAGR